MSLANLLVENNYRIECESITLDGGSSINSYEEGSFMVTIVGYTTPLQITVNYIKQNNKVSLFFPQFLSVVQGGGSLLTNTGTAIPTNLRPSSNQFKMVNIQNASANIAGSGVIVINTSGLFTVSIDGTGALIFSAGQGGIPHGFEISYLV